MKRSTTKLLVIAQVLALLGVLLSAVGLAEARTQPRMTISPSIGVVQRSFPAFTGFSPPRALATQIKNCRDGQQNATYCDHIPLTASVPPNYKPIHKVRISMTWNPGTGPAPNDLIMYLFPDPEVAVGDDELLNTSGSNNDTAAGKKPPREINVGEMSGNFTLNVTNQNAGNTGYIIKLEWIVVNLGPDYPGPEKDDTQPSFSPTPAKKAAPINPAFGLGPPDEEETITVKVPGPDGELIDVEIPLVKAAGVARKAETTSNPVVPIILGLLGLGLVLFLYFFVWRRRRGEEAA